MATVTGFRVGYGDRHISDNPQVRPHIRAGGAEGIRTPDLLIANETTPNPSTTEGEK